MSFLHSGGNGPTRSTWRLRKRPAGGNREKRGALLCRWILAARQLWHYLHHFLTSFLSPCQTNRSAIARWVGQGPEWDKECTVANTLRVHSRGMTGRGFPRDTSHRRVVSSKGTSCKTSPVIAVRYALILIDDDWSLASWWRSMKSIVVSCIRDKASATTLCLPRMYWMSEVNSAINERCRAWRGDRSAVLARA